MANSTPAAPLSAEALETFRQETLEAHNNRRELHQVAPVKLSAELTLMSQKWAEYLATEGKFEHSPGDQRKGVGENIAGNSKLINGDEMVQMWYSEIDNYNFAKPVFGMNTSHFTQVVWKDCNEIGVGVSPNKGVTGMYLFVVNYKPHGNVKGFFDVNVLPQKK